MLNQFQNIIFDLDGTLVNSSEEVLVCFKKAFDKANYPVDESRLTSDIIGPPLRQILETIAPELPDEDKISEISLDTASLVKLMFIREESSVQSTEW